jgi:hypothetical protein
MSAGSLLRALGNDGLQLLICPTIAPLHHCSRCLSNRGPIPPTCHSGEAPLKGLKRLSELLKLKPIPCLLQTYARSLGRFWRLFLAPNHSLPPSVISFDQ